MTLLDRHIAWTFVKVFLGALVICTVAVGALDFVGRVGYFLKEDSVAGTHAEGWSRFKIVAMFYAAYLPLVIKEVFPFVSVAAALLTVSAMLRRNEVFPVVAAGVSMRRLFLPVFAGAALVSIGHLAFQEYVVPMLGREQIALKRFFQGDRTKGLENIVHLRDAGGSVTRAGAYSFADGSLSRVIVQKPWTEAGFERWRAPRLVPDGAGWVAPDGVTVEPAGVETVAVKRPPGTRVDLGISPADVEALTSKEGTGELSFGQLQALANRFPNRRHLRIELHKQIARPLSSFALVLCGVPVLLAAGRSVFWGGAIGFALSALYYFMDIFFTSSGARGDIPVVFAAYFPIAFLVSFGLARLITLRT
ncbi:MAG: LptF/LptG family permease [Planctomycetota bacterium]|nr:LptF/LptG family permease [Planctomycetota bacterium]